MTVNKHFFDYIEEFPRILRATNRKLKWSPFSPPPLKEDAGKTPRDYNNQLESGKFYFRLTSTSPPPTPRQNALRISTNLSFRSVTHFRLCIKIQCKQAKIQYREV